VEAPGKSGENRLPGRIERVVYAGPISHLVVTLDRGEHVQCMLANDGVDAPFERGAPVSVYLPCEALRVLRTDATVTQEEDGLSPAVSARATTKS
jgi:hypothetical protein